MSLFLSLAIVLGVALAGFAATAAAPLRLAAIAFVYASIATCVGGVAWRVWRWGRSPVPFRVPTTAGQQRSLASITAAPLDNPSSVRGAVARVALEVLLFRSLFRGTRNAILGDAGLVSRDAKGLWLGALAFHWSLLLVSLRHLRFFFDPAPAPVRALVSIDAFFGIAMKPVYVTDVALLAALGYLLGRRLANARLRYASLFSDYLAVVLLLAIAASGLVMRHVVGVDAASVKQYAMALAMGSPGLAPAPGGWFFAHLFLVCVLLVYVPFSKLLHAPGILFAPTRNLPNDSRARRHLNPWNPTVPVHTYEQWEEQFRDKIQTAGLPMETR